MSKGLEHEHFMKFDIKIKQMHINFAYLSHTPGCDKV